MKIFHAFFTCVCDSGRAARASAFIAVPGAMRNPEGVSHKAKAAEVDIPADAFTVMLKRD
jgi:hypothetical protein